MIWRWTKILLPLLMFTSIAAVLVIVGVVRANHGQFLSIQTGSMTPAIPRGNMVVIFPAQVSILHRGDVITFVDPYDPLVTLTHRIVNTPAMLKIGKFQTKGDSNKSADMPISPSAIVGKVGYAIPKLGYLANFLRTPLGLLLVIYLPSLVIVSAEVRRVIRYYQDQEASATTKSDNSTSHQTLTRTLVIIVAVSIPLTLAGLVYAALQSQSSLSGNVISATVPQLPVCYESGTLTQNTTWTPDCVYVPNDVEIPSGITLTIDSGTIVKPESGTGIQVDSGGTLTANGAPSQPIVFTSFLDDSVGGNSSGEDSATSPVAGNYNNAITMDGGTVNVAYADLEYASTDITSGAGTNGINLTATDSQFTNSDTGISLPYAQSENLTLLRNQFALNTQPSGDYYDYANAISVENDPDLTGIPLSGPNENTFTGTGANVTVASASSTVPSGATLTVGSSSGAIFEPSDDTVNGTVALDPDVTFSGDSYGYGVSAISVNGAVTLASGDVVKYGEIQVNTGGTLTATGTSDNPIIFTSPNDESVGGSTPGTGGVYGNSAPGQPAAGDYNSAVTMDGGTADISFAHFEYADTDITSDAGGNAVNLTVTDSQFTNSNDGIDLPYTPSEIMSLQRNQFALDTPGGGYDSGQLNYAIGVGNDADLTGIVLSGANENTFTGSGSNVGVYTSWSDVPSGATWTVDSSSGALLSTYEDTVDGALDLGSNDTLLGGYPNVGITVKGTVTLAAGDVVKAGSILVNPGGTLTATGTSDNPVAFTSPNDNSVGGETPGYGGGSPAPGDYSNAITLDGGTVNVSYADFEYATTDITSDAGGYAVNLTVTDSQFTNSSNGIDLPYDSSEIISLQRNHFALNTSGSTYDSGQLNYAIGVEDDPNLTGIVLSGANENTFSGSGPNVAISTSWSDVPSGATWMVATLSGALLSCYEDTVDGALTLGSDVTLLGGTPNVGITVNGTVSMADGDVVKAGAIQVNSGGTLTATGTADNPVIFTSPKDNSAGGNTPGYGASGPAPGDYSNAITMNGGTANVSFADFEYATTAIATTAPPGTTTPGAGSNVQISNSDFQNDQTGGSIGGGQVNFESTTMNNLDVGLNVSGNAAVVYRGTFANIQKQSITACDWGSGCGVDATYTDWGNANGPVAPNPDNVCGGVTVAPWVYEGKTQPEPSDTNLPNPATYNLFYIGNCGGNPTPDQSLLSGASSYTLSIDGYQTQCNDGTQTACELLQQEYSCINDYISADASAAGFPLPSSSPSEQATTFAGQAISNADTAVNLIEPDSVAGSALSTIDQVFQPVTGLISIENEYHACAQ